MRSSKGIHFLAAMIGIFAFLAPASHSSASDGEIRMGVLAPLTGSIASFGQEQQNATKMAVDEINAAGGILGKKIQLFIQDDENKPDQAAAAAQKLINDNKVTVIIGGMSSSCTMAAAPIAQRAGVIMISPWSTNPKATAAGDFIFRACFSDEFQGAVQANYAVKALGKKRIAQLLDVSNDGSKGQGEVFQKAAKALGAEIIAVESFGGGDRDFKSQLTKIKATNPDLLDLPNYYAEDALIMSQAKELGLNIPVIGGDGNDSPDLIKIGGASVEGFYFTNHYSPDDPRKEVKTFRDKYQGQFKAVPGAGAALSYDAVLLYKMGAEVAKSLDSAKVRDSLKDLKNVTGLVTASSFSFDANRNGVKSAVILQVSGGKVLYKDTANP
jgi:branched-chain amino acid transport system substrate-binding protein